MKCLSPKLKSKLSAFWQNLDPYKDVIIFVVALFVSNGIWKLCIHGDEDNSAVTFLGLNATPFFQWFSEITAEAVYWIVSLFRDTIYQADAITLRFVTGGGSKIVWSCTPIKQSFIWLCILLVTIGDWKSKAWFIPFGWVAIFLFNILRISAITFFMESHPDWFEILHSYIFKYLFYGFMFLLWVWYVEKLRKVPQNTLSEAE